MSAPLSLRAPLATLGLALLCGSACANRTVETTDRGEASQPPVEVVAVAEPAPVVEDEDVVALARALHDANLREVVPDPRGEAALTLDTEGGVRLWTAIRSQDAKRPLALPVQEPSWMSIARDAEGRFVVAFVDTAGAGQVARVEQDGERATLRVLFDIPATDPQFELHVLDGGERILTLGKDHRVRLLDTKGRMVSEIDQTGFVPWQLRVSQRPEGGISVVAVLAGPTRVQPLSVANDAVAIEGQARTVVIDRGPNRNDLSLSPDGRSVVALRKPRSRSERVVLEHVDLATDTRTLLVGELDNRSLPRLHWIDDQHVMLESGSGKGFVADLGTAIPWTGETGRKQTDPVAAVPLTVVPLVESTTDLRSNAMIVAGLRLVPTPDALVVDPLDQPHHLRWSQSRVSTRSVALDASGRHAAWGIGQRLVIDEVGAAEPRIVDGLGQSPIELAFVSDERLLVVGDGGQVSLVGRDDGRVAQSLALPPAEGERDAGFVFAQAGQGRVAVSIDGASTFQVIEVSAQGLGAVTDRPAPERVAWPEIPLARRDKEALLGTLQFTTVEARRIRDVVQDGRGGHLLVGQGEIPVLFAVGDGSTVEISLRGGQVQRVVPNPEGTHVAVVQRTRMSEVFVEFERVTDFDEYAVSVYDLASGQRQWTRSARGFHDLDWSGDGRRLGLATHDGGLVVEAESGALVLARRDLGLQVTEVADPTLP